MDIQMNEQCLHQLEENPVLLFSIEHIHLNAANEVSTAQYDSTLPPSDTNLANKSAEISFQNVVIADMYGHTSSNKLCAAAIHHVNKKGGSCIQVPHDRDTENEVHKDIPFPMIYPTLFPYGISVSIWPFTSFRVHIYLIY
jgi:hypothetical protein